MTFLAIGSGILICAGLFLIFWLQRDTPAENAADHEDSFVGEVRALLQEFYPDTAFTSVSYTHLTLPTKA